MSKVSLVVSLVLIATSNLVLAQSQITGKVEPIPDHHFLGSPQKDWPVTKIHVKVGNHVKAGDCLVELDPAIFPVERARAQLESTRCQIDVIKSRLANHELMLGRSRRLVKTNATSQQQCDEDAETVKVLEHQLIQANADCKVAEASFKMAQYDFDTYQRINSLIDGEVVAIKCSLGMIARAEDRQISWIEVLDSSRVQISCSVLPKVASQLRQSLGEKKPVRIVDSEIVAHLVAVPRIIVNGKVPVILEADNPNLELICGQEVNIVLP